MIKHCCALRWGIYCSTWHSLSMTTAWITYIGIIWVRASTLKMLSSWGLCCCDEAVKMSQGLWWGSTEGDTEKVSWCRWVAWPSSRWKWLVYRRSRSRKLRAWLRGQLGPMVATLLSLSVWDTGVLVYPAVNSPTEEDTSLMLSSGWP
jgi:hypothetical protein